MPKLSDVELLPNDILLADLSDEAISRLSAAAAALGLSFSDYVLERLATDYGMPRESLASATVIVLDPQ